jgi:uncharacterized protein (DUF58 family)
MIVPTQRLLIYYAVAIPPLALIFLLGDSATLPAIALGSALILIAMVDAAWAHSRLQSIDVGLSATARMTKDRPGSLEISLHNVSMKARTVRLGLALPGEIVRLQEDLLVALPEAAEYSRIPWPCTPAKRGTFHIDRCYVESQSILGLWAFRSARDVTCEVRVYPNLSQEHSNLAALFLNRRGFGIHAQRQHGKGREFERLREYIPSDGYDEIHWKATAKRRRPITKVFQIERTQEVYVIIDTSRLSARPQPASHDHSTGEDNKAIDESDTQLERFIAAALVVGLAAQKQGDLFGIGAFSDSVQGFLRAGAGKAHYSACREHIFGLHPRMVNPDYEELCTFIRLKLRRRALIMILTSLDDPVLAESFIKSTELICRHHLLMVNMFRPPHARPVFTNPDIASTEEIYSELSGHGLWHNLREIERTLAGHGVRFSLLDNERFCVDLVSQYMNVKQRQLL